MPSLKCITNLVLVPVEFDSSCMRKKQVMGQDIRLSWGSRSWAIGTTYAPPIWFIHSHPVLDPVPKRFKAKIRIINIVITVKKKKSLYVFYIEVEYQNSNSRSLKSCTTFLPSQSDARGFIFICWVRQYILFGEMEKKTYTILGLKNPP